MTESDPFVEISNDDFKRLLSVLRQRLPITVHEYNMLLLNIRNPRKNTHIYTLHGKLDSEATVLLMDIREDFGQDISMSVPLNFEINETFKHAMLNTKAIDWKGPYIFTCIDSRITPMIVHISARLKKNSLIYNPCYQFFFDTVNSDKLDFSDVNNNIELKPLEKTTGAKFLVDNWKYQKPGTLEHVESTLETYPSVGVYVDGHLACGAMVTTHGLIGRLYTDPAYRRQGLAQFAMRYLFKELAKIGMIPCSSATIENVESTSFHEKIGMTMSHEVDYIIHTVYTEDME